MDAATFARGRQAGERDRARRGERRGWRGGDDEPLRALRAGDARGRRRHDGHRGLRRGARGWRRRLARALPRHAARVSPATSCSGRSRSRRPARWRRSRRRSCSAARSRPGHVPPSPPHHRGVPRHPVPARFYLARHIEVDEEQHGPLRSPAARRALRRRRCAMAEGEGRGRAALVARRRLWDGVTASLREPELRGADDDPAPARPSRLTPPPR